MILSGYSWVAKEGDRVFLDANAWIYAIGPNNSPEDPKIDIYSNLIRQIVEKKVSVYYDQLVISEFVNRCLRISYSLFKSEDAYKDYTYKQYRGTDEYKTTLEELGLALKFLDRLASPIFATSSEVVFSDIFAIFSTTSSDINDLMISSLCIQRDLKVITEDGDMSMLNCDVITYNKSVLRKQGLL